MLSPFQESAMRYDPNLPDTHFLSENLINRWYNLSFENLIPETLRDALELLRNVCLNKLCDPVPEITEPAISLNDLIKGDVQAPPWLFEAFRLFEVSRALDDFYSKPQQDSQTRTICDAAVRLYHETSNCNSTQAERLASENAYQQRLRNGGIESPSTLSAAYLRKD